MALRGRRTRALKDVPGAVTRPAARVSVRLRAAFAVLAALALAAALAPAAHAAARPGPAAAAEQAVDGPVVVVGVPGLMWEEIDPETMPRLWALAQDSAIGDMSIRTATSRTCPVDGWLTLSAGQRAFSQRQQYFICELPVAPERDGRGAVFPDYEDFVEENAASAYGARVGALGGAVREAGGTTLAVGAGAALAAADHDGRVDTYVSGVGGLRQEDLDAATLAVIDLDGLADLYLEPPVDPDAEVDEEVDGPDAEDEPEPDPIQHEHRLEALAAIDDELGRVLDVLPDDATLMVAGVSVEAGESNLNAALLHGPGPGGTRFDGGFLTSDSTRRDGLVTLTDATATVVSSMGLPTSGMVGRVWKQGERPGDFATAVGDLADLNTAAKVVGSLTAGFFAFFVALQLLIYAAAAYALHRYSDRDRKKRDLVLSVTRVVALGGAAFPVSSYLSNLIPWWSSDAPQLALIGCVLLTDAVVVALAMAGPWRRGILGPMTVVAGITTAVLFIDMLTGANLQLNSPTGYTPIVAGRFYGLGNIAFATFATGMLMAVAGVAHYLIRRGHRTAAVATAAVVGTATIFVIGWPGLGTDFGGVIAIIPGLAVTVLMISGRRVTWRWSLGIAATAVGVIGLMAYLDFLRPPSERSHFGLFFSQLLGGEAATVISRKLAAMLGSLGNWQLTLLSACALLFLFAVLNKPTDWRMGALQRAYEYAPTLRAGLTGSLVTALVGFAVNDSGIAIPALALTVAVPLTLSACTWVLQQEGPLERDGVRGGDDSGRSEARTPL
ncbi:hypothetical protein HNR23_003693 [Nocardiopsis mwathae]|uniref:Uncharacterized protein n=1 Tax=Nocardiopsis mwathae TaxID=1472723 RepID=A0A7W9YK44_9ACTN|nr:hypothetical protein [Nocardiopsis mwathae]MBB6173633.1 hypothetical protein [Nocardiopsis mwathae]